MEYVEIQFLFSEPFSSSFINDFVDACTDNGCTIESVKILDKEQNVADFEPEDEMTKSKIQTLASIQSGRIKFWHRGYDFLLFINVMGEMSSAKSYDSVIGISIEPIYFEEVNGHRDKEETQQNALNFIELVRNLSEFASPAHVFGNESSIALDEPVFHTPIEDLERGIVEGVYWLNVFSPRTVERIGRERVLSAPAWRVEELEDGAVLIVLADNPLEVGEVYDAGKRVEEHLGIK